MRTKTSYFASQKIECSTPLRPIQHIHLNSIRGVSPKQSCCNFPKYQAAERIRKVHDKQSQRQMIKLPNENYKSCQNCQRQLQHEGVFFFSKRKQKTQHLRMCLQLPCSRFCLKTKGLGSSGNESFNQRQVLNFK